MDLISQTLHYIGKNYPNASVIQIGAMDGINFDDTRGFLDMYKWDSLLIEPIPDIFNELKENFKDRTNYIFEQCLQLLSYLHIDHISAQLKLLLFYV